MKLYLITVLGIVLLFLVACGSAEPEPVPTDTPAPPTNTPLPTNTSPPPTETPVPEITSGDPERGRLIFENGGASENYKDNAVCFRCHDLDDSGERVHNGPSLKGISERAGERVPGLSAAQYIHQSIMDPRAYIVEDYSFMPLAIRRLLSEDEVADLVAFLLTQ